MRGAGECGRRGGGRRLLGTGDAEMRVRRSVAALWLAAVGGGAGNVGDAAGATSGAGFASRAGVVQATGVGAEDGVQDAFAEIAADTTEIHVGDRATVDLAVVHPAGWAVQWPDSFDLGPFEALGVQLDEPAAEGGRIRSVARLTITSFELGELDIPAISVVVAGPDGAADTVLANPFRIGVTSVGLDDTGEIRDIKGPLALSRHWWGPVLWAIAAAVAGAACVLAWQRRKKRSRPSAIPSKPARPARPPHLAALEALDALEASALLERGQVKEYHVRASDILRTYLEVKLEVPALELTTGEVVAEMRRAALGADICERVRFFLEACDLVKFAKLRPSAEDSRKRLASARKIVELTSGVPDEFDEPDGPESVDSSEAGRHVHDPGDATDSSVNSGLAGAAPSDRRTSGS